MLRKTVAPAALGALLATGALAQNTNEQTDQLTPPAAMTPAAPTADAAPAAKSTAVVDVAGMAVSKLIGASIQNGSGENIAKVDDVIMTADGKVENVAAAFGGVLGFGKDKVLLTLDEVKFVQDDSGTLIVRTDLTPDALKNRPAYQS